ncbi:MAG: hypothetical protein JKY33_10665 [Bacteroidia bacterium]|nr:hypothetical protein [Bacteroidia bacterium]
MRGYYYGSDERNLGNLNMNEYIVIHNSDGDTIVKSFSKEELEERLLEEHCFGNALSSIPDNNDPSYWGDSFLIIKGEVITPIITEFITKIELPK